MAFVILDGTGDYRVQGWTFRPGATEVPDNDPVLVHLAADLPEFIRIQSDREPVHEPIPLGPAPETRPYEKFKGRDGKWYFLSPSGQQSKGYLHREEAEQAIMAERNRIPLATDLAKMDRRQGGVARLEDVMPEHEVECRAPTCYRRFRNRQAEENHVRIMHPDRV